MANDDTIDSVVERISSARDRCVNAGDQKGAADADRALADLQGLTPSALPTAHEIEDYFNQRIGGVKLSEGGAEVGEPRDADPRSWWARLFRRRTGVERGVSRGSNSTDSSDDDS